jgi:hypothetical protein
VPDVDAIGGRSAARVQKERLPLLIAVQDGLEVAVGEDNSAAQEVVRSLARDALEAGEQLVVDLLGAELVDQLVVVDGLDHTVGADLARHLCRASSCQRSLEDFSRECWY